ncbi:hypothetical protein FRC12_022934 [Ceratobasidium sp. 428]|nr:hypothetical protein FRC12_022934 [Ceratobasidium sp. 428]
MLSPRSSQGSSSQVSTSYSFSYPTVTSPAKSSGLKAPQQKHSFTKFSPIASPSSQERSRGKMPAPKVPSKQATMQQQQFCQDAAQSAVEECLDKLQWLSVMNPQTELIAIDMLTDGLHRRQAELTVQEVDKRMSGSVVASTLYDSNGNDIGNAPGPSSRSSQSSQSRSTRSTRYI